jgi:cell shape-determining protein MreC
VRGDVIGRHPDSRDRLEIHVESGDLSGLEVGMPVVSGDAFVGRVRELDRSRTGVAWVELVTARGAFVGARVETARANESPALVVGGVAGTSSSAGQAYLAVHHPEDPEVFAGRVVVDETWSHFERFARESAGFELGWLERDPTGAAVVRPTVDYENGLFHVAIVCPADIARAAEGAHADELESGRWVRARVLSSRDPARAFGGLVVAAGADDGVRPGAAAVHGTRLVGRVEAVTKWSAKIALLGSRGFALGAVARVASDERPAALGEIRSLGERDSAGAARFVWCAPRELAGETSATSGAILFTGSGDRGVPRGLIVGYAQLPAHAAAASEFSLSDFADGSALGEVWIFAPADDREEGVE